MEEIAEVFKKPGCGSYPGGVKLRVIRQPGTAPDRDRVERIDGELIRLAADLRSCRARSQHQMAARLTGLIDQRLDERWDADTDASAPYCP